MLSHIDVKFKVKMYKQRIVQYNCTQEVNLQYIAVSTNVNGSLEKDKNIFGRLVLHAEPNTNLLSPSSI